MILPSFVGIVINHFKDPYLKTSILDTTRVFFVAQLIYWYACDAWSKKNSFSVKLTFSHLKIDGWKTIRLPFGSIFCLFSGANLLLVFGGVPFKQLLGNLGVTLQHAFLGKNIDPNHTRKGTDKKTGAQKMDNTFTCLPGIWICFSLVQTSRNVPKFNSLPGLRNDEVNNFYLFCRNVHLLKPPWTLKKCWVSNRTLFFQGSNFHVPAVGLGECNFSGFNSSVLRIRIPWDENTVVFTFSKHFS